MSVTEKRIVFKYADPTLSTPGAPVWILIPILFDDDRTLENWCERYCPIDTWNPFTPTAHDARHFTDGHLTGTLEYGLRQPAMGGVEPPRWTQRPRLQLNQLYWPNGASRHAIGHFVIAAQDATKLIDAITDAEFPDASQDLVQSRRSYLVVEEVTTELDDNGDFVDETIDSIDVYWANMFPIAFRPIGSAGEMYAMTLVDHRWMVRHVFAGPEAFDDGMFAFNYSATSWEPATDITGVESDLNLLDNTTGTGKPLSNAFMVDAMADAHLKRWTYPISGSVPEAHDPSWALTRLGENDVANLDLISGGEFPSPFTFPKSLLFDCPGKRGSDPTNWNAGVFGLESQNWFRVLTRDSGTDSGDVADFGDSYATIDTGRFGWRIESSFDAYGLRADTNYKSTATAIAVAMLARMRLWAAKCYDYTFSGLVPWKMTGFDDYVIWSFGTQHWERMDDPQQEADGVDYRPEIEDPYQSLWTTRVVSYPMDHFPRRVSQRSAAATRLDRNAEWLVVRVAQDQRDPPDGAGPQGPNGGILAQVLQSLNGEAIDGEFLAGSTIEVMQFPPFASSNSYFRANTDWIAKWDFGRGLYRFWSHRFDPSLWRDSLGNPLQPAP